MTVIPRYLHQSCSLLKAAVGQDQPPEAALALRKGLTRPGGQQRQQGKRILLPLGRTQLPAGPLQSGTEDGNSREITGKEQDRL